MSYMSGNCIDVMVLTHVVGSIAKKEAKLRM